MRPYEEIRAASHRLANQAHQPNGAFEGLLSGLPRIIRRYSAGGIEFQSGETLSDVFGGARGRSIRIMVELVAFAGSGIEIGVAAQALVNLAAEQVVDRLFGGLADDVPACHFQSADDAHQRKIGP